MPTRKPRRTPKPARPLTVPIVDLETTQLRSLLGLEDDSGASAVLSELSRFLDHWASALVNIPNVGLRSDFISHAEPLAKRAESFWNVVMRADPALLSLAEYCGFVSVHALETQLRGFGLTAEWIKQEKSKKGGERRSFRKQTNDEWRAQLDAWFDRNVCAMPARRHNLNKQKFVRLVEALVERAVAHA